MKTYAQKSSATRAAKSAHGANWAASFTIDATGEGFVLTPISRTLPPPPAEIILNPALLAIPPAPPAPIIPASLSHEAVAIPLPPIPTPPSPEPEQIASPIIPSVPSIHAAAAVEMFGELDLGRVAKPTVSTIKLPTKKVWDIADKMPGAKRKDVIEACVQQGIAYGTARTQYQHWFKCLNDSKSAPIAVIGADGKISLPK